MAAWQEPAKNLGGWVFHIRNSKIGVVFNGYDVRKAPFEGHFLRYEGAEEPPANWRRKPDDWFTLRPHELLRAASMEEAKSLFSPLLAQIADGSIDDQFERQPYKPPVLPQVVREIEHPTYVAKVLIVQYPEGRYELRFRVYAPDGKYFPAQTPSIGELGWEWGRARIETTTFADDLASAEQAALVELDEIVQADPEIKRREQTA